jgi:hypothetical protein
VTAKAAELYHYLTLPTVSLPRWLFVPMRDRMFDGLDTKQILDPG